MWAVVKINQVTQVIHGGAGVVIEDVRHPPAIFGNAWTDAQRAEIGILPYQESSKDEKHYTYRGERLDIQKDRVVKVWDIVKPKPIADLRNEYIRQTDQTAIQKLSATDWYVTRKTETSKAIPKKISDHREAIRTAWESIVSAIKGCSNVDEIKLLLAPPKDKKGNPTEGNPAMYDWPDDLD